MDSVVNLGIPHIGEQIFEHMKTADLIKYLSVSKAWKILAENVLFQRWNGKLLEACQDGKAEIVKILLDHPSSANIDINARLSVDGKNAFMLACQKGCNDIVKSFLDHSSIIETIDINAKDRLGETAFMSACVYGHIDVVKVLLGHEISQRIDFNIQDNFGETAISLAKVMRRNDIIELISQNMYYKLQNLEIK